jgi:exoribonuclease R
MMIRMSHSAAQQLERGMFRSIESDDDNELSQSLPPQVRGFMQGWTSTGARYTTHPAPHDFLGLGRYVHVTSPIRRLPDIVNGLLLQSQLGLLPDASDFVDYWMERVDQINAQMKSIRRLQIQCELLDRLSSVVGEKLDVEHDGFIVDPFEGEEDEQHRYVVYLPEIKLVATHRTREKLKRLSRHQFRLRIFKNEDTFKKKIRLERIVG